MIGIGPATIRRLLRSGWALLVLGVAAGFVISTLLAEWPPSNGSGQAARSQATVVMPSPPPDPAAGSPVAASPALQPMRPASPAAMPPEPLPKPAPKVSAPPLAREPDAAGPAWRRNAVPVPDPAGRPMIAIVIDDLGVNRANSRRVIELPAPLTLAFLTYAADLEDQTRAARAAGHELMVHFPMEPLSGEADSGPNALEVGLSPEELRRRLDWGLSRFDGYVGMNNHMGSRFTGWEPGMTVVLEELRRRGLLFLDSRTIATSVAARVADAVGVPHAARDVFLDNEASAEAVRRQLAKIESIARRHGSAIAIGHPHEGTIEALREWLPSLAERGFTLVPVSAIVRRTIAVAG